VAITKYYPPQASQIRLALLRLRLPRLRARNLQNLSEGRAVDMKTPTASNINMSSDLKRALTGVDVVIQS
jgi:hypothetical protein